MPTEIERKFDVVDSTVAPSFDGLTAITRTERVASASLDAVYFDTPGLDLREVQQSLLDAEERLLSVQYQTKLAELSLQQISGNIMSYL